MKPEQKGSQTPSVAKHREVGTAARIIVASDINTSSFALVGREAVNRPPNEDLIRAVPGARVQANRCAPVVVA